MCLFLKGHWARCVVCLFLICNFAHFHQSIMAVTDVLIIVIGLCTIAFCV